MMLESNVWGESSFLFIHTTWIGNDLLKIRKMNSAELILKTAYSSTIALAAILKTRGAFHLVKISGISGSAVNGTRVVGSSHWKIPRKSGKSKKVVPFSRLEFPNGISCSIYVCRSLYQFQVHGRAPPRTVVYDHMEQLFTNRKFHFCYHRNFRGFFLNGKRPRSARRLARCLLPAFLCAHIFIKRETSGYEADPPRSP